MNQKAKTILVHQTDEFDAIFIPSTNRNTYSVASIIMKTNHMEEKIVVDLRTALEKNRKYFPCSLFFEVSNIDTVTIRSLYDIAKMIMELEREGTGFIKTAIVCQASKKKWLDFLWYLKTPKKPTRTYTMDEIDAAYNFVFDATA